MDSNIRDLNILINYDPETIERCISYMIDHRLIIGLDDYIKYVELNYYDILNYNNFTIHSKQINKNIKIKKAIKNYKLIENKDYILITKKILGIFKYHEYIFTLNAYNKITNYNNIIYNKYLLFLKRAYQLYSTYLKLI